MLGAERRRLDRWGARVNYVYSVLKDNQAGEGNAFANNPQAAIDNSDLEREYGYSLRDAPHRLNLSGTWQLPFGWSLSGVAFYQSGFPFPVIQGANAAAPFGFGQRPDRVPGVDAVLSGDQAGTYDATCSCVRWLNPAAWRAAAPFTLGNAPHADATARTPTLTNLDLSVAKGITVASTKVTLRADVFNVFDHATFFSPAVVFGTSTFGQIRRDGGFPRTLQLMVRVAW